MSWPHIITWAVVLCVGLPAAYRNPTAAALSLAWLAGELTWMWTGNSLPLSVYFMADIAVIAVIFMKPDYKPCERYLSTWHQFKCILLERSPSDRFVIGGFLAAWYFYVSGIHPYYQWFALWAILLLQFLFASAESLEKFWASRSIVERHLGDFTANFFAAFSVHPVFLPRAAERAFVTVARGGGDG